MAVDTTLIKGAYSANKPQGVIGNKEIAEIGESITGGIATYMAGIKAKHTIRNAEYDAYAESVLDNSDLVGEQYEALYDDLALGKEDFANADKKSRALQIRDLKAMAGDYEDYKALREDVAINKDDLSPAFTNSEEGQMYLDILKGDGQNLVKKNGRIGVEVDGEWKSISSIKQSLDSNKIDKTSIETLEAFRIKTQADEDDFDYDKTRTTMMNSMVSKGNYRSLINDEIIPGRIFRNDLMESLTNKTYSDLGITEEDLLEVEGVDISDGIDVEEAETIANHLEQDKTEMKEVLTDYYTTYIGNNGGSSSSSVSSSGSQEHESVTDIDGNPVANEKVWSNRQQTLINEGYDIEADGQWGPKSQEAWEDYNRGISTGERNRRIQQEQIELGSESPATTDDVGDGESVDNDGVWVPEETTSEAYSPSLSRSQVRAVESLSIQSTPNGGANILENGNAITMDIEGGIATVDAVRADGNSIVVDTSGFMAPGKNAPFGKFTKQGDGYKWEPDMAMQKKFAKYASENQKSAMMTFINLMETDPQYAKALINHIGKDEGTINAATLK